MQRFADRHDEVRQNANNLAPSSPGPIPAIAFDMDDAFKLHRDITERIIQIFWTVVNELGTGYLEKIYHRAMVIALKEAGFEVDEKYTTAVYFRGREIGRHTFDLVVNGCVLLELKATSAFERAHAAQALGYLRSSPLEVALILNFGLNPSVKRVSLTNDRKQRRLPERSDAEAAPGKTYDEGPQSRS